MDFSRRSFHRSLSNSLQASVVSTVGMQRLGMTPSVYGGAGGRGIRISNSRHTVNYGSDLTGGGDLFVGNEKMAMQNLNDRLASYLEKVRTLEQSNSKLEVQIKQWYETNAPRAGRDYGAYYKQIEELRNQEVDGLYKHLGNTVNVEVDAAPGLNLGAIMNEMRQKYEVMAQKNLQEAKEQFERQKESLEHTLEETKARYSSQLANLQSLLSSLEAQLMQLRSDMERQNNEYHILLDIKTRLEQEIATYRRLLEGEDVRTTEYQLSTLEERDIKKTRKIKTVVQEVVDGKVVSSEVKEVEENI
ncbi:hypothetical protein H8958_002754 [Nasalis larvatus]